MAEVEALYACALTESSETNEKQLFADLARAAAALSELAGDLAGDQVAPARVRVTEGAPSSSSSASPCSGRARIRRRIAGAEHTADWIIARLQGDSAA
ncbi:hypothetical protein J4573_40485 [Actinomadura barringtoniae]|uniref:Uncharacterized protein n=1 Tax=Actinomadura barringtoniae TaxID=1427535 RepID=A0A939TBD1_9ACTN|nr:hypothetical protein [Actinomadura barringtoniae]MBO2453427.1 hypothetical protein [Actinomadura barringtoniae]